MSAGVGPVQTGRAVREPVRVAGADSVTVAVTVAGE